MMIATTLPLSGGTYNDSNPAIAKAFERFGITEEMLRCVIHKALAKGGDYADLYFEHTFRNSVGLQDKAVNRTNSAIEYGVGVRVIAGDQTGYSYTENITLDDMLRAAESAAMIADLPHPHHSPEAITALKHRNDFYPIVRPWESISVKEKIPHLQQLNDRIFELDPRVTRVNILLDDTTSHILFYNSETLLYVDYRPMVTFIASCVMEHQGASERNCATRSFRIGAEFLTPTLIEEMAQEAVQKTAILFNASKPKGGEMPVVMGAGGSGILLHEAIGHAFEADFNRKNTSIFSDQLGQKICNAQINVVDDATIPHNRGSLNIDDEGTLGQKTYIVKEGVLNSYLHDRISARHYGVEPTGNGRRESFRNIPIPRMRSTYMEAGTSTQQEMIEQIHQGIFVDNFSNGQVQIGAGNFTFFVKSGYLIENGRLTQPIKDINIIGNGPKALADITIVGNNPIIDNGTWTCGKDGQSAPVTCGMPSVLVKSLTVGGE